MIRFRMMTEEKKSDIASEDAVQERVGDSETEWESETDNEDDKTDIHLFLGKAKHTN